MSHPPTEAPPTGPELAARWQAIGQEWASWYQRAASGFAGGSAPQTLSGTDLSGAAAPGTVDPAEARRAQRQIPGALGGPLVRGDHCALGRRGRYPPDTRGRACGARRSPLQGPRMARGALLRAPQAGLPPLRRIPDRARNARRAAGTRQAPARIRHQAIRGCARADQLRGDQSRGAEARSLHRGREPRAGSRESGRGHEARPHLAERRERLRSRPQSRDRRPAASSIATS